MSIQKLHRTRELIFSNAKLVCMSLPKDSLLLKNKEAWATPEKEGHLKKMGAVNKAMKRRFFALQGANLFYFKKKGALPVNSISLIDSFVETTPGDPLEFTIQSLHFERVFTLRADTLELRIEWVEAVSAAISAHGGEITLPQDLQHNFHVSFDPDNGYQVSRPR
jgi:hypothetical protein